MPAAFNRAQLAVQRYQSDLNSFLAIGKNSITECIVPSRIPDIQVDAAEALDLAIKNNPDILGQEQQLLEQDQSVARAKSEAGLNTSIFAQYGLNQSSDTFSEVYDNPDKSQRLQLGITIPILDWGRRKGQLLMAESNREVVNARIKQERIDFEQNIVQSVMEFNLQSEQVRNAAIADTVAQKGYEVTFQRFLIGKVDVLKLNQARNDRESARKSYISAVNSYWTYFYRLRLLTLYDFINRKPLLEEYDQLLENSSSWK
jgi:outer membrane protein TolC